MKVMFAVLTFYLIFMSGFAMDAASTEDTAAASQRAQSSKVAFDELALASNSMVGNGLKSNLVAEAFSLLDVDMNGELSPDEMAPIMVPLLKMYGSQYTDDSAQYARREKFVNHVFVPDVTSGLSGEEDDDIDELCEVYNMFAGISSTQMWEEVFGDVAEVEIEEWSLTLYRYMAEGKVIRLIDLEGMILSETQTSQQTTKISIDEISSDDDLCGRRQLFGRGGPRCGMYAYSSGSAAECAFAGSFGYGMSDYACMMASDSPDECYSGGPSFSSYISELMGADLFYLQMFGLCRNSYGYGPLNTFMTAFGHGSAGNGFATPIFNGLCVTSPFMIPGDFLDMYP